MQMTPDNAFLKRCPEVKQNKNKCPKRLAEVFYARSIFGNKLAGVFLVHYYIGLYHVNNDGGAGSPWDSLPRCDSDSLKKKQKTG